MFNFPFFLKSKIKLFLKILKFRYHNYFNFLQMLMLLVLLNSVLDG
nr:MAG TPA: hypothetical protein [Bacteriophage sp.]